MYILRYLEETVLKIHRTFKVLYLGGPRQVGKTTLLQHLADRLKMHYVSLDVSAHRNLAQSDPDLFLEKYPPPLLIDEVQYAPELFSPIKIRADQTKKNGLYWLSGSQQFALIHNLKESLAGRVGIISLLGFSMAEEKKIPKSKYVFVPGTLLQSAGKITIRTLFQRIVRGSFPLLSQKHAIPLETFYDSYVQTYIDRDLGAFFEFTKIRAFGNFLRLCAARTGQILNYSSLASDAGVSVPTVQTWISLLEASKHIYLLQPYHRNISKRIIKSPKLYFLDTGLAAFLTKWKTPEILMEGAMAGAFFETFVMSEIIKSYLYRGEEPPLYYFRDKEGHEVDCLIVRNGKIFPLEIKLSATAKVSDCKNINYLRKKLSTITKGAIICLAQERFPLDRDNEAIPVSMIT